MQHPRLIYSLLFSCCAILSAAQCPNNPSKGWDGRFRNQDMPIGTYAFFAEIELVDGDTRLLNGTITLVR